MNPLVDYLGILTSPSTDPAQGDMVVRGPSGGWTTIPMGPPNTVLLVDPTTELPKWDGLAGVGGPIGPIGPEGPEGPAGSSISFTTFTQSSPSTVWTIVHDLGRIPFGLQVFDGDGSERELPSITNPDHSTTIITFLTPISGKVTYA
jgi:hypothetical protein